MSDEHFAEVYNNFLNQIGGPDYLPYFSINAEFLRTAPSGTEGSCAHQ